MSGLSRCQIRVIGVVQGVGFRPFVYRLATELHLGGWIYNDTTGVLIEVEGPHEQILTFLNRLPREKPPPAFIYAIDHRFITPRGESTFIIRPSPPAAASARVWVLPDLAVCDACRREMNDPHDRRYRYPFINCTHCGPRFTIIESLPYDRPRTAMKTFTMCEACAAEYHDPTDRRFHAQPIACPTCGPHLSWIVHGHVEAERDAALEKAVEAIRTGAIVAVKGLGGYHLIVDARNESAVAELRRRKRRPFKAFALMYPNLEALRRHVDVPEWAVPILQSPQAPILLLPRIDAGFTEIAPSVAPGSPYLGVFLPYTPLHARLLDHLGFPVVATSGNRTDEPIAFREPGAFKQLADLCDAFLTHNRPIVRHADDSVIHVIRRPHPRPQMLRRARGYTPLPVLAPHPLPPIVALGGHMHVTIAFSRDREIIVSQHLGDMDTPVARAVLRQTLNDLLTLYRVNPEAVAHDLHPDYFTTALAHELDLPRIAVQHHHAHMVACMLENGLEGPVLGLTWDGTGYGPDGTVWGGEILLGDARAYRRVGSLHPFRLPGGEQAVREPWRTALALLWETYGTDSPRDLPLFQAIPANRTHGILRLLERNFAWPVTTSMGRLFDGVAALLGIAYVNTHQAQAPQQLEYAAWRAGPNAGRSYPLTIRENGDRFVLDWRPMIHAIVADIRRGTPVEAIAAGFHDVVVRAAVEVIHRVGQSRIVMAGGVFCNRYLTEALLLELESAGLQGYIHSQLPPTDGSLAVGQLYIAAARDTT